MVAGGVLTLIGLRWLSWFEVTDGLRTIDSMTYEEIYGDSVLVPVAFVAAGIVAGFINSDSERRIGRWAGLAVIVVGLGWMWLLVDRALIDQPTAFSGLGPGLVAALVGTLIALVGTDLVTIWAWINRRRTEPSGGGALNS